MQEQFQVVHYLLESGEVAGPGKMLRDRSGLGRVLSGAVETNSSQTNRQGRDAQH